MKNTYKFVILAIPALIAMTSLSANAALISSSNTVLAADGSNIVTTGTTLFAADIGEIDGSDSNPTIGGVTYTANAPLPGTPLVYGTDDNGNTQAHYTGADMRQLMGDNAAVENNTTMTLGGLEIGQTYMVQFFHHYDIDVITEMGVHFGDEIGTSPGDFEFSDDAGNISTFVWIADTVDQDFTITTASYGVVNGLLLQTVPEPSAALLGGLGALALLRRRRN